jgi:outer membrane protein assembly factor BamB/Icc-related predicted phosphoesterase
MKANRKQFNRFIHKIAVFFILFILTDAGAIFGQESVIFAFLTDLHVSPGQASDSSLHAMVDEINRAVVDFTVITGDISNTGSDDELLAVQKALSKLNKPCYILPGNHETNWSESAGLTFNKLWGNDRFLFKYKGYMFVGLNTGPFMKMGDGYVKGEDLNWLKRQLVQRKSKNDVLISFTHYPLAEGLDNWNEVTDLLKSFNCRIGFCGHGHRLSLLNFDGILGIMGRSGLPENSGPSGYNIVKLQNDSVLVFNKGLSAPPGKPIISINYQAADTLSKIAVSSKPDFSVNKVYTNREIVAELSDTASILSGPCLVNDTVLIYGNSLGWLKAISTTKKRIIWQVQLKGPVYSTPVSTGGVVVLGVVDGSVIGLDAFTGKQFWIVKTGRPVLSEGIVEDNSVYIGAGDRSFYRINTRSGKIIWQYSGVEGLIQGKPAISGSSVFFGAWDTHLYCLDKNTGTLSWKWDNGRPQKLYSPGNIYPVCTDDRVFIVAPDRYMTAINIKSGKEIWRTNRHQVRESIGASPDGSLIYAKLMNDSLIAVSAIENYPKTVWAVNAGFGYEHNPCPVMATGNNVILATRNGIVIDIDPEARRILWKYKAGNSSVNKVVADRENTFWLTLTEGKILGIKSIN